MMQNSRRPRAVVSAAAASPVSRTQAAIEIQEAPPINVIRNATTGGYLVILDEQRADRIEKHLALLETRIEMLEAALGNREEEEALEDCESLGEEDDEEEEEDEEPEEKLKAFVVDPVEKKDVGDSLQSEEDEDYDPTKEEEEESSDDEGDTDEDEGDEEEDEGDEEEEEEEDKKEEAPVVEAPKEEKKAPAKEEKKAEDVPVEEEEEEEAPAPRSRRSTRKRTK